MRRLRDQHLTAQSSELVRQLGGALLYPLRGHALPVIVVFALLFWLGSASILGLVATAIAISWPMKYAYHLLEHTALGHDHPPAMTAEMVNPLSQQPLKHLAIILALCSLGYWTHSTFGPFAAGLVLAAGLAVQPACAAVIALEDSLLRALDPQTLLGFVRVLGVDYFIIATALALAGVLVYGIAGAVPRGIWFAILLYALFLTFHLVGLAVYRHRDALGVDANVTPERAEREFDDAHRKHLNRTLDDVYQLADAGRTQAAIDALLDALAQHGDRLEDHRYAHEQTLTWSSATVALRQGQVYITRLVRVRALAEAVTVYASCYKRSQEFRLERAVQVLPLARCAQTLQKTAIAIHMLHAFELRFPEHPDCGAVAHLRAELVAAVV